MPRSIWTGVASFGLVNVSVKLFSAVEDEDVHFHQLHHETGERIRYQRVAERSGDEVLYEDIAEGYELYDEARRRQIPGRSKMSKEQLVAALRDALPEAS